MDAFVKLQDIALHMDLEPAEETQLRPPPTIAPCGQAIAPAKKPTKQETMGIFHASAGGKTVPLLKTMLTTACERNCYYCPFRAGRNYRRTTFTPDEMAKTFMDMNRAGLVQGLFLSSGIIGGGAKTQDKLLATAELLRQRYQFKGYIHLKIMPGVEKAQVEQAMNLADRLSINLEAPNDQRLLLLAPRKQFVTELLQPLQWIEQIRQTQRPQHTWNGKWPSTVTQFVVGAVGESDVEILTTTQYLYQQLRLRRTYFSAFSPILNTPLENVPAENPQRKNRLYQTSFLFRDYGFDLEEMPFDPNGNLPLHIDPKLAWAKTNLLERPVELNHAAPEELLRVPGVGPKGSEAILRARKQTRLRDLKDLQTIGVQTRRLAPFVLLDGKRPTYQLSFLEE